LGWGRVKPRIWRAKGSVAGWDRHECRSLPRFALRVVKEQLEKKVLRRLRFVCCTCLRGSTSADGRWRLSG
jgi:hypothetical protein